MMANPIERKANHAEHQRGQRPNKGREQDQRMASDATLDGIAPDADGKHDVHPNHRHNEKDAQYLADWPKPRQV